MITTSKGETSLQGSYNELIADFSVITKTLTETLGDAVGIDKAKADVEEALRLGLLTSEKLDAEIDEFAEAALKAFGSETESIKTLSKIAETIYGEGITTEPFKQLIRKLWKSKLANNEEEE